MRLSCVLAGICLVSCAADDAVLGPDTEEIEADDKADGELRVRIDGLTIWLDRSVRLTSDASRPWRLEGRASRNLEGVFSFVGDDALGEASVRSARTFEISMSNDELRWTALGAPLFVQVTPTTGAAGTAAVWLTPRLGEFTGTARLRLDQTVATRWVAGQPVFRGGARTDAGWTASATGPSAPQVFADDEAQRWRLDWQTAAFFAGAAAPFSFHADDGTGAVAKRARPGFAVKRAGLTRLDPYEVWPIACKPAVRACLDALPVGTVDAGTCGTYSEVRWCGGLTVATSPAPARVVDDLRAHLAGYYAARGDVEASGGQPLAAAQAAVDAARVSAVTDPEEDPFANDLGTRWVFRHPDVVYPGSDLAWFVVYDKATGALVEVVDFN